jgi:hypothetical protein
LLQHQSVEICQTTTLVCMGQAALDCRGSSEHKTGRET